MDAPTSRSPKRWDLAINWTILFALLFLVFSPSGGGLGRLLRTQYGEWRDGRRVAAVWADLTKGAGTLVGTDTSSADTIVMFIDYECPGCRLIAPSMRQMTERSGLVVVVRHLPNDIQHAVAKEAAAAAVCGEQMGRWNAVHRSLLETDGWLANLDWTSFARGHGIADPSGFVGCMDSDETATRIRSDSLWAVRLGIVGTPTFVSRNGIYEGAAGFGSAVADLVSGSSPAVVRDSLSTLVPDPHVSFDSRDHSSRELAELGRLIGGFLISQDTLVVIDGPRFLFVDLSTGMLRSVGSVGEGPGEFRMISQVVRGPSHFVAWDNMLGRVTRISHAGQVLDVSSIDFFSEFNSPLTELIAAFDDGALVFEDGPPPTVRPTTGRFRPSVTYREVRSGDEQLVITEAAGQELFGTGQLVYPPVLFGHDVHAVRMGRNLAVAQTDWNEIRLYGRDGDLRQEIPLEPGVTPTNGELAEARASLAEWWLERQARTAAVMRRAGLPDGLVGGGSELGDVPANEVAPGIDRMFVDGTGRLWARRYQVTASDPVVWLAFDARDYQPLFRLRLGEDTALIDAFGEVLLLGLQDDMDVDYFMVTTMLPSGAA